MTTRAKKLALVIPLLVIALLLSLFWHALYSAGNAHMTSSVVGEPLPKFSLPTLTNPREHFSSKELRGRVSLLNVWASWCSACQREHAMLMRIKDEYHVPIYGILYRDHAEDAVAWLRRAGNPYVVTGDDAEGNVSIDLGIYGTPETYIISPEGRILYRHVGIITAYTWEHTLYPLIKQYEKS